MWIFTLDGFFSAVQDRDNPNRIMVRARVREDIDRLAERLAELTSSPAPEVLAWAGSDYAFRVFIPRATWGRYLARLVTEMEYTNFKAAVPHTSTYRSAAYMSVWGRMAQWQRQEAMETAYPGLEIPDASQTLTWETRGLDDPFPWEDDPQNPDETVDF